MVSVKLKLWETTAGSDIRSHTRFGEGVAARVCAHFTNDREAHVRAVEVRTTFRSEAMGNLR